MNIDIFDDEFDADACITSNRRILISEGLQAASGKGEFQPGDRNGCEKYNDNEDEWFCGYDEKGKDVYMKHCGNEIGRDLIKKWQMERGRKIVPKTEQVRKNVKL